MSSTTAETRTERADRLRDAVQELVDRSSWRQAADVAQVSVGALRSFLGGGVPQEATLEALEAWAQRAGVIEPEVASVSPRSEWLDPVTIGKKIREIREQAGLSQQQLSERLGMQKGQAEISRWERGERRPGYEALADIAYIGGKDVSIFQKGSRPVALTAAEQEIADLRVKLAAIAQESSAALQLLSQLVPPLSAKSTESFDYKIPGKLEREIIRFLVQELGYSAERIRVDPAGGPDIVVLAPDDETILIEVKVHGRYPAAISGGAGAEVRAPQDQAPASPPGSIAAKKPLPPEDPRYLSGEDAKSAAQAYEYAEPHLPQAQAEEASPARAAQGDRRTSRKGTTSMKEKGGGG